ncbi:hypothetical protein SAMN04488063_0537 [Halopelagius inordinatus]|uniref:UPF0215 protein SAMN04488063_0537 n=1 Tax=Halopelagius inordinatus TaxID=553467 RepID=A0A1I2M474_9EURY|nr:DUF99 family protein [Halopelagius inordinatus]SFF85569.1 hypothetical protein SAMN04488063_0537 [Halopelagius inordinatus]
MTTPPKPGARALGVAESYRGTGGESNRSTLCGALVRADRVVDGVVYGSCTVGGTDATRAVQTLFSTLGREDVRYLVVSGVAPAWFNVLDLRRVAEATGRPTISVSFEESEGLEPALREQFSGDELDERLAVYRSLPPRRSVDVGDETVFVRAVGLDAPEAAAVVRAFTPEGGRPEPVRVARTAARAARSWRERERDGQPGASGDHHE